MKKDFRKCPLCKGNSIDTKELSNGARCLSCHSLIEVNIYYSWGMSIILCAITVLLFKQSFVTIGWFSLFVMIIFTSNYKYWITNYFPLKSYERNKNV